jgi:large subunit ribosomal protein L9e
MRPVLTTHIVDVPAEVTVEIKSRQVKVTGARGVLRRDFRHFPCDIRVLKEDGETKVRIDVWFGNKKAVAGTRTIGTHVKNLILGVTVGFERKMRFVYAHFPIQLGLPLEDPATGEKVEEGRIVEIRNFLGEHVVRRIYMLDGVVASRGGKDEIIVQGNDLELVSQSAANIHQSCLVKNKDIRKFLDGVYVSEKNFAVKEDD